MGFWKRIFGGPAVRDKTEPTLSPEPSRPTPIAPAARKPISLKATDYGDAPPKTWDALLAPGWVLEGSFTMWEVATFIREQKAQFPDVRLFGILEDVGQAFYTSGHALGSNGLDVIDTEGQQGLHPESFKVLEEGEAPTFIGLTHPSEFPIRHKIFMDFVGQSGATAWHNTMMWNDCGAGCPTLVAGSKERPLTDSWEWSRDDRSFVTRVVVPKACEAIAIFPNGYFSDDMQPEDNYYLAKALEENFGLEIFGLGATYAGYMRDAALTAEEAQALGKFLGPLYSNEPQDVAEKIAALATGEHTLFLAYANR